MVHLRGNEHSKLSNIFNNWLSVYFFLVGAYRKYSGRRGTDLAQAQLAPSEGCVMKTRTSEARVFPEIIENVF